MADFTPKKVKADAGKANDGVLAHDNTEHQAPPVLHLEDHHISKLLPHGKMPKVGSKIRVSGLVHVGAHSEHTAHPPSGGKAKGGEGNTKRTMTLHFHKMDMGDGATSDEEKDESQKAGAKAEIDKALERQQGGKKAKGEEGYEGANAQDTTPRGTNAPRA